MGYRLGLDLGTNSIGWTVLTVDPVKEGLERFSLLDMGVRIFPDSREPAKGGRVGDSLAVARREGRGMRRNRDRGKNRMAYMMRYLVDLGLMPSDKEERHELENLNPYQLRAEGLERPLSPFELGRALFQLGLRRGFKSNRKESNEAKEETARAQQINTLREALGNKTLGQFLWQRLQAGESVRFKEGTDWFPDRAMYAEEFNVLKDRQLPHHQLSEEEWDRLRDNCILFQHPLRPVERGRCTLRPEYRRAHRDTPIAQWFRIYQDVGNLRWIDEELQSHPLTPEQRDAIVQTLLTQKTVTWGGIRKLKDADGKPLFHRDYRFNLE
ncbi:type II CRISPR RNA-guided endonuclease Cas9 [Terasakiella sp.]|uniref:type II CRISPR RNA-guided endonuclease Cas9 n=1 Tax=Terasakiella sp. TaxID=2034861 RepID=UPI003AA9A8C0